MRSIGVFIVSMGCAAAAAADLPQVRLDIDINLADQRVVHLALSPPDDTTQRLQVEGDLGLNVKVWWINGHRQMRVILQRTSDRGEQQLSDVFYDTRSDGQVQRLSISVCGDRTISRSDAPPGDCRSLPPMAKPDPVLYPVGCPCFGPYEGMPTEIASHTRIAPSSEPGEPLTLTGRVLGTDGRPKAGVIVYAYHTDRHGIYRRPDPPRSDQSQFHGVLRGWARSDAQGRYTFDTIRPANYPDSNVPQHIHMHVIEPGCATYVVDEVRFLDDPKLQDASPETRAKESPGIGGPAEVAPHRKGKGWEVTRDIHLGEKVPGYTACPASR